MSIKAQPVLEQTVPIVMRIRAHLAIARFDHIAKNAFILPSVLIPLTVQPILAGPRLAMRIGVGFVAASLVASSNYVIGEVLDAPYDRFRPRKSSRPGVDGLVNVPLAYVQWVLIIIIGISQGLLVSRPFPIVLAILWLMGRIYNIPPIRTKDLPYLDVRSGHSEVAY